MTWRHALGLAALRVEDRCVAIAARLALWRQAYAPETLEPPPPDLWEKVSARLAVETPAVVGFCCGQTFTSYEQHHAHARRCEARFYVPTPGRRDPRREGQA